MCVKNVGLHRVGAEHAVTTRWHHFAVSVYLQHVGTNTNSTIMSSTLSIQGIGFFCWMFEEKQNYLTNMKLYLIYFKHSSGSLQTFLIIISFSIAGYGSCSPQPIASPHPSAPAVRVAFGPWRGVLRTQAATSAAAAALATVQ